jgi:hypothetical protein
LPARAGQRHPRRFDHDLKGLPMNPRYLAVFAFLFIGCASGFRPMRQDTYEYESPRDTTGVQVKYMYNVLGETGNTLYSEKARSQGVDVVAVKVTNNTDRELDVKRDVDFYVGGNQASPQRPEAALANVRQRTGLYAWWFLLALVNGKKTEVTCDFNRCDEDETFIPIGIIIGPAIALTNMGIASSANGAIIKEISDKDVSRRTLKPGESYEGYLVFENIGKAALTAKVRP